MASPVGRSGVEPKRLSRSCLAASTASQSAWSEVPSTDRLRCRARARAEAAALSRSLSPGERGDSSKTAAQAAAEASHQPASRHGMLLAGAAVATGST